MRVHLAYGRRGLEIDAPEGAAVVEPRYEPALPDPQTALRMALQHPIGGDSLASLVKPTDTVALVISDMTRPMPTAAVLHAILDELPHVPRERITIFIGLGTHRQMTQAEIRTLLGDDIVKSVRVDQADPQDPQQFSAVGVTRAGHTVRLYTPYLRCSAKIITGLMEPHFFAGVSGGPKGIMPGLASVDTVIANHAPDVLLHPQTTWGVTRGNPLWEDIREAALLSAPTFMANVAVNKEKAITAVFAGDIQLAFAQGARYVRQTAMAPVPRRYDVVVTTNSGYPLDLNLYQAVKGMSAAAQIVEPGGDILAACECSDGIPTGGRWEKGLRAATSAEDILAGIDDGRFAGADQWELLLYAQILQKARVHLKSTLSDADARACFALPVHDVSATLDALAAGGKSVCILPEGPQTAPYVRTE